MSIVENIALFLFSYFGLGAKFTKKKLIFSGKGMGKGTKKVWMSLFSRFGIGLLDPQYN